MAVSSKRKYGFNPEPRLSANQLSEYLSATPTRRKGIIREAKFPKKSVVARYDGARDGITKFLCDKARSGLILTEAIDGMRLREGRATATDWTKEDCRASIEAIDTFHRTQNALGFPKLECRRVVGNQPKLVVEGVELSVALDVTTHRRDRAGTQRVGGLILLFSKSEASSKAREARCRLSAILAVLFAEKHLMFLGETDPKICLSLDVFGKRLYPAPGSYIKRLDHIQTSCEEVALRWPKIDPPGDYDGPSP